MVNRSKESEKCESAETYKRVAERVESLALWWK